MLARFLRARALLSQFTIAIRFAKAGAISTAKKSNISKIGSRKVLPVDMDKKSRAMAVKGKKDQRPELAASAKNEKQQSSKKCEKSKQQRAKKSLLLAKRKEHLKVKREKLKQQRAKKSLLLAKRKEANKAKLQRKIALANKKREQLAKIKASTKAQRSKLIDKPWESKGKLCTQPALLYVSEKMKTYQRSPDESPLSAVQKFRKEYVALNTEQKAPYVATAAANRTARAGAKAKVKGIRMGPYSLFMKENYHNVSSSLPGADGVAKMPLITKEIARRWKDLTTEQKAAYKVKADGIRAEAEKNLNQLMQSK